VLKSHKYILVGIIGTICITSLLLYNFGLVPGVESPLSSSSSNSDEEFANNESEGEGIVLIVDYSNSSKKFVENITVTPDNNTVFDVLLAFCDIEYTEYPGGSVFIDSIDGIENKDPNWWQYWVNDEYAPVGASSYHLNDEDKIEWVYGKPSSNADDDDDDDDDDDNFVEGMRLEIEPFLIIIICSIIATSSLIYILKKKRNNIIIN
jgi:hypothetical protein